MTDRITQPEQTHHADRHTLNLSLIYVIILRVQNDRKLAVFMAAEPDGPRHLVSCMFVCARACVCLCARACVSARLCVFAAR